MNKIRFIMYFYLTTLPTHSWGISQCLRRIRRIAWIQKTLATDSLRAKLIQQLHDQTHTATPDYSKLDHLKAAARSNLQRQSDGADKALNYYL